MLYPPSKQTALTSVLAGAGWSGTVAYREDLDYQQGVLAGAIADHTDEGAPQDHYLSLAVTTQYQDVGLERAAAYHT